jgi:hypothetical protein
MSNDRFVTEKLGEHEGDIKFLRDEIVGLAREMRELNIKLDLLVTLLRRDVL